jgi:hypothetical protein
MSDMPSKQESKLKITSYTGNVYLPKISEIKNCEYSDELFDYTTPEVTKPAPVPRKIFENSTPDKGTLPDFYKIILEAISEITEAIPEYQKRNIQAFLEGLHAQGVDFEIVDEKSMEIATLAMHTEDPSKIDDYVNKFIAHLKNKNN